ncbi:MAG: DUF1801 domain-containing protein [Burkholderiales bacterium]|nr:DUF1801 domain-containing protein [Burkholderiales bacterium]
MRAGTRSKALVGAWLDFQPPAQREVAQALRAAVREVEPELGEAIRWGQLVFLWGGSPLLAIAPHRGHVNLQVFNGHQLSDALLPPDPSGRPGGPRSLRCRLHQPVDTPRVRDVVRASAARARETGLGRPPPTGDAPDAVGDGDAPDAPGSGQAR